MMLSFKEFILSEMPHIIMPSGKVIDLEFERFTDVDTATFEKYVQNVLGGEEQKTKYGSSFKITVSKDREFLKKKLKDDHTIVSFIKKFHPEFKLEK